MMSDYTVKKSDRKSWKSLAQTLSETIKSEDPEAAILKRPFNEYLTISTDDTCSITFLSPNHRDQVMSFIDSPKYVREFLNNADEKAIKEYCRTSKYEPRSKERILRIDPELYEDFIKRIGEDILNHPTIEDSSIHQLVSEKCKHMHD
jgi:hypothetical protein